ncbi:MAG: hypothetical protein ABWY27_05595 [Telluria sp.]
MTSSLPTRLDHLATFALVVLLSACGGGGGGTAPAPLAAATPAPTSPSAVPASTAPTVVAPSDMPRPPATADAADNINGAYTLLPPTATGDTGGEPPYPDLSMLPTRIMPFEAKVYGDVSAVAVTSTN